VHELRNHVNSATFAARALEAGKLPMAGATAEVLKRSLVSMSALLSRPLGDVRATSAALGTKQLFSLAAFVAQAQNVASLATNARGCSLNVVAVDPLLAIEGNRELLLAALMNLIQNAFKFTRDDTQVTVNAYAKLNRVVIEVSDHCGGLPPPMVELVFKPFVQAGQDRSGLGLGLSMARQSVEADGGVLSVRNAPGAGCTFSISLALHTLK
jgi:signal transduction histidine kinase